MHVAPHVAHIGLVEAHREPVFRGEHDVVGPARHLHVDQLVLLVDLDRLDSGLPNVRIFRKRCLLDGAVAGAKEQELSLREFAHRHHRLDLRLRRDVDQVDDRFALGRATRLRNLIDFQPKAPAIVGEAKYVVVCRADEETLDKILVLQSLTAQAAPATALLAIGRDRGALDVTRVGDGDDHVLLGDQILARELAFIAGDLGATLVAVLVGDRLQLIADDLHAARLRREDVLHLLDEAAHALELFFEL